MVDLDPQKKLRMAMNGRTTLLCAGIFMVITAVTATISYGLNLVMLASGAAGGNTEYLEMLETANMSISLVRIIGICFILVGIMEVCTGVFAFRLSNRIDKSALMKKLILVLLVVEILMQVFLFFVHMLNLGTTITAIALPLFMLWGVNKFRKLAEDDPKRVYAIDTKKSREKSKPTVQKPYPSGKSLRERAMMITPDSPAYTPKPQETSDDTTESTSEECAEDTVTESRSEETFSPEDDLDTSNDTPDSEEE